MTDEKLDKPKVRDVEQSWSMSVKHLIGAGLVTILAFVVRFVLPLPFAMDIYVHDSYRVVPLRVVSFWVLLVTSAAWLVIAAFKLIRHP
jgi:hypothetical protein